MFLNYSKNNSSDFPLVTSLVKRSGKKKIITYLVLGNFLTHFLQVTLGKDQTHISLIQKYPAKTVTLFIYQTLKAQKKKDLHFKVPEATG